MATTEALGTFVAASNSPPTTNPATPDERNDHDVLDFDADTDESAIFKSVMPQNYAAGGITIVIHYTMSTATSGTVRLDAAIERLDVDGPDIDSDSFAAVQSVTATVPGVAGDPGSATITMTSGGQMDSLAKGDMYRIKITRDADNGSSLDTATGDFELHAVEIKET